MKPDLKAGDKIPYVSITTDSRFIYIHSELEGLIKVGSGFDYTMFGKVYVHIPDFRLKEKGTLAFIYTNNKKGKLFYRSP